MTCKRENRPLVREGARIGQDCNYQTVNKYLIMSPRRGTKPKQTQTHKVTQTLSLSLSLSAVTVPLLSHTRCCYNPTVATISILLFSHCCHNPIFFTIPLLSQSHCCHIQHLLQYHCHHIRVVGTVPLLSHCRCCHNPTIQLLSHSHLFTIQMLPSTWARVHSWHISCLPLAVAPRGTSLPLPVPL
jgi:hypothetical protein